MTLLIRQATDDDFPAIEQLLELYQHDLSHLWLQDPDVDGRYGFDLTRHRRAEGSRAYIARRGVVPLGVALVAPAIVTRRDGCWMEQFFVLKRERRAGVGRALAQHVLRSHPGPWELGQMPGNEAATAFWRRVIGEITGGSYRELHVTEGWWQGLVQQFDVPSGPVPAAP